MHCITASTISNKSILCRCKYSEYGCEMKDLLSSLLRHEEVCPERTIHCPQPNGCNEEVQLKKFCQHALSSGCSVEMKTDRTKFNLSKGWMQWDGLSLRKGSFSIQSNLSFLQPKVKFIFYSISCTPRCS